MHCAGRSVKLRQNAADWPHSRRACGVVSASVRRSGASSRLARCGVSKMQRFWRKCESAFKTQKAPRDGGAFDVSLRLLRWAGPLFQSAYLFFVLGSDARQLFDGGSELLHREGCVFGDGLQPVEPFVCFTLVGRYRFDLLDKLEDVGVQIAEHSGLEFPVKGERIYAFVYGAWGPLLILIRHVPYVLSLIVALAFAARLRVPVRRAMAFTFAPADTEEEKF